MTATSILEVIDETAPTAPLIAALTRVTEERNRARAIIHSAYDAWHMESRGRALDILHAGVVTNPGPVDEPVEPTIFVCGPTGEGGYDKAVSEYWESVGFARGFDEGRRTAAS